jgi:hypothetical protein
MKEEDRMKEIRNQNIESKDVIIPNDKKWSEKMRNYKAEKNAYNFNLSHFPGHVTHKFIKEQENSFNPIIQKYTDNTQEKTIKEFDKICKTDDISKGYDYELNLESTYNVINLRNKLKGLNYSQDKYTHDKRQKNNTEINKLFKPYNIISNNSFKKQHYLPPELRERFNGLENCTEGIMPLKKKKDYYNDKYGKDFDIISNKYLMFHKEKEATEKEIQSLAAAKKIQNLRTYDIIKRRYINPEIEENYRKSTELKQMSKINNAVKDKIKNKNYMICNPINNEVYDKEAQKKQDEKDFEKLEKYRLKNKIESLYRNVDINHEIKIDNKYKNIGKILENKIIDDRGYNIINNTIFNDNNRINKFKKFKIMSDWEKLKSLADEKNSTFDKKAIYKSMYDKSDVNENFKNYLIKRRQKLKDLSPLNQDPIFKVSAENEKLRNNSSFTKTFNFSSKTVNNKRNNTVENEEKRGRNFITYKFNKSNIVNKKTFYENNRNILDYDNRDNIPVLVDKNINTRYFKNYLAKFRK